MRDKIIKGCVALGLRQIISLPLNAAGLSIASIFLSPTDFGVLAIITVLTNLALVVIDLGTTNALVQTKNEPTLQLLRKVQCSKNGAGLTCVLLYVLLSPWITAYYHLPNWMGILFPSCGLIAWLQSQRGYQSIWLQRRMEWQALARVEMIEILTYNIILVITAYVLRSPAAFVLSIGVRMALGATFLSYFSRNHRETLKSAGCSFRALLGFGIPCQVTTALSMIQKALNPIIVGSIGGVGAVGFVNWSNYIVSLPMLPLQPLYAFLFSVVSERQRHGLDDNEVIQALVRLGCVVMSFISMVFILVLPSIVTHVLGRQWLEAVPVASVLLIGNTVTLPSSIITTHLTAKGYATTWMQIVVVESILIWIMGGLGAVTFGLLGYAAGMVGAGVVVLTIQCSLARKLTGLKVRFSDSIRLMIVLILSIVVSQKIGLILPQRAGWVEIWPIISAIIVFIGILALTDHKRHRQDLTMLCLKISSHTCS
jgi:O-antigen/teichoic acid export membrane protein